jgi:hypothetical protein
MRFQIPVGRVQGLPDAVKVGMAANGRRALRWLGRGFSLFGGLFCLFALPGWLTLLRLRD